MRTNGLHRIKAWGTSRLRRLSSAYAQWLEKRRSSEPNGMLTAIRNQLERLGERLEQPKNRRVLRWLTFVFLIGAAYGLWQGSQETLPTSPSPSIAGVDASENAPGTVVELASRVGNSVLNANLPARQLPDAVRSMEAYDAAALPADRPTLPSILDLSQVVWPVTGGVQGEYGWYRDRLTDDWRFRSGLVLVPDRDPAPVRASLSGAVVDVRTSGTGYHVVIAHAEGWQTEYVGLSAVEVTVGSQVEAGETIGEYRSAPHREGLFYTVRGPNGPTDPSGILYTRVAG